MRLQSPEKVKILLVNEVAPANPADDFYAPGPDAAYAQSLLSLFAEAGIEAPGMDALLAKGIYVINAVKTPKDGYDIPLATIKASLPALEGEIRALPGLCAILLMGDVAKKAFNLMVKAETGKNCIPTGSTYKLRREAYFYGSIRVFPSYICTGGNILIEKSKRRMIAEDLKAAMALL